MTGGELRELTQKELDKRFTAGETLMFYWIDDEVFEDSWEQEDILFMTKTVKIHDWW